MAGTLEREDELGRLAGALASAAGGAGCTVVLEGPAGIGKTRLVQDTRALAKAQGFARLQATGDELDAALPWGVVRQLVERSIARYQGDVRAALLAGPSGAALKAIGEAPSDLADAAGARTLHALWWVAVDLSASRPLLITVDDAQWADQPSLRFLEHLSRRIADLPIALVLATRPAGPDAPALARDAARLAPRPLSPDALAALAAWGPAEPAPAVVAALATASGGNPFLAERLVEELHAAGHPVGDARSATEVARLGPSAISRALLGRLPADAIALATGAAILGARSAPWTAAAIAGLDGPRAAAARDALVTEHVLAADAADLRFVHPVVREAVLARTGPGARSTLHAAAARVLHAAAEPGPRVAAHLALAPPGTLPDAVAILREAAAALLADGDAPTAARHLERARDEAPSDLDLRAALGFALLRAGQAGPAREHLLATATVATPARPRAERLAAAAAATARLGRAGDAVAELRLALHDWPGPPEDPPRLLLEARLAVLSSLLPEEGEEAARRLEAFAGLPGATREERTLLSVLAQRGRYAVRPAHEVARLAARALSDGRHLADSDQDAEGFLSWAVAAVALAAADEVAPAAREVAAARAQVQAGGSPVEFATVCIVGAWLAWRCGDLTGAEADSDAALAALADEGPRQQLAAVRATATHCAVLALLERGDLDGATARLEGLDALLAAEPPTLPLSSLREARALTALAREDVVTAEAEALALGREALAARTDTPTIAWRVPAALTALRAGREAEARELAAAHLELARRWGAATDVGIALRLVARIDPDGRLERLGEAITALEASPARLELAKALTDQGEALRVARRRREAHAPLERADELAKACGATALRRRVAESLAAIGDRPQPLMFSGHEGLTASERRVARLARDGRSNREIAQELFVTPKTVENHLGRVYVKLGIAGRRELAAALA